MNEEGSLKDWVRREMTMQGIGVLDQAKERAARLFGISQDGSVGFRLSGSQLNRLNSRDKVLLYTIGKVYAHAAEYAVDATVANAELVRNLGMPEGTVRGKLKELRDAHYLNSVQDGIHSIAMNRILEALSEIEKKIGA